MRYRVGHKEKTRDRIVRSAAKELRRKGIEAVRVADVMASAGLTNGGFYKHFGSKEQLVCEAITNALQEVADRLLQQTKGLAREAALRAVIEFYLSEEHLEHPDHGCTVAALGTEMARLRRPVRPAMGNALEAYAASLQPLMPGGSDEERYAAFLVLFSSMAGCVMAARIYVDKKRQRQVLAAARLFFTHAFCDAASPSMLRANP